VTAPSLIQYAESVNWTVSGTKATGTLTWLTGDLIVVVGGDENAATLAAPTAAGLSFSPVSGVLSGTAGSSCGANAWTATAASGSSSTVSGTGAGSDAWGFACWVFRGSDGVGNTAASGAASTALTISLTRSGTNSRVVGIGLDWAGAATTGYAFTPALGTDGHDRVHVQDSGHYTVYVADWDDQGSPGATSYGISGVTGVSQFTKVYLEILGTGGGAPTSANAGVAAATGAVVNPAGLDGTGFLFAGAAAGVSGSWADTGNAVGSTTGTYATWTDAGSGTSATLELSTFGVQAAVPSGATVGDVQVRVRHSEDPASQVASVTAQAYLATSPYGSPQTLTVSATVHEDTVTVAGLTRTDLADLRIRVTATRAA
jgi:hypothetical protein